MKILAVTTFALLVLGALHASAETSGGRSGGDWIMNGPSFQGIRWNGAVLAKPRGKPTALQADAQLRDVRVRHLRLADGMRVGSDPR